VSSADHIRPALYEAKGTSDEDVQNFDYANGYNVAFGYGNLATLLKSR